MAGDDDPWTTEWVPAFEAKAHRIELATDAAFASLELRQEVPGSVRRFVARRVKPGVYHLRVRSIDAEDYLGIASETRKTAIARVNVVEGSLERTPEGALVTPSTRLSVVAPPGTNVSLEDGTSIASDAPFVLAGRPAAIIVRMGGAEARLALRYPARPEVASSELAARKEEVAQAPTLVDMASPQPFAWGATPGALGGPSPLWVPRSSSWAVVSGGASTSLEAPEGAGSFRVAGLAPLGPAGLELELRSERASDAMARADLALAGWVGVRSSFLSLEDAEVWDVGAAVRAGFPMGPAALPPRVEGAAAVTAQLGAFTLVLDAGLRLVADGSGAGARGAIGFGAAFVAYEALPWLSILAGVDGASVRAAEAFLPDVGLVGGVELGAAEWFVGTVTRVSPLTSELGQVSAAVSFGARGP
ncbi:MAG: hypothetical protein IPM79_34470 [Polyangiaceae bacterium]|nr:hypothetical protein [Polyangiaceae bacterium]MBK8942565.1 hypothetical protein [Polyangiaceae bacterium]